VPKITGTKYFSHRARFIQTGDLKAFDLMMKHYQARIEQDLPVGNFSHDLQWSDMECIHPLARPVGSINEFEAESEPVLRLPDCPGECIVHICERCVCFFARHSILTGCKDPLFYTEGVGFDLPLVPRSRRRDSASWDQIPF
jgi:hypothetical protein